AAVFRREPFEADEILRETLPAEIAPPLFEEALRFGEIARRREFGAECLLEVRALGGPEQGRRPEAASKVFGLPLREPHALGMSGTRHLEGLRSASPFLAQAVHGGQGGVGEQLRLR